MTAFKAIAAMSENRVIGQGGKIPWHLPDDFKWFKKATTGKILVMGRRTIQSIGRPLPDRHTIILSRRFKKPSDIVIASKGQLELFKTGTCDVASSVKRLDELVADDPREVFVAGGAEIYALLLPRCTDLYLTRVKRTVEGDTFFPPFEDQFVHVGNVMETADFTVEHHQHRQRQIA